jgi:hypothetical protein
MEANKKVPIADGTKLQVLATPVLERSRVRRAFL